MVKIIYERNTVISRAENFAKLITEKSWQRLYSVNILFFRFIALPGKQTYSGKKSVSKVKRKENYNSMSPVIIIINT